MIKRMGLFQRRQDLTQTQFSAYWAKKHSPLVVQMPRFIRYVQNHRMDLLPNFTSQHLSFDLDGIAEMYWHSENEMQADFSSQQGIDILRQDETEFMSNISVCIVNEDELQGSQSDIKIMLCLSQILPEFDLDMLRLALPHVIGMQSSTVTQVMYRPQLPATSNIPQQFISLWFEYYETVQQDFNALMWTHFYSSTFKNIERMSLIMFCPLKIRER